MIHHLFVLDFVMIIILQKRKRQNCMKSKILFRVLLTIIPNRSLGFEKEFFYHCFYAGACFLYEETAVTGNGRNT